jgi:hypothetical protein
MVVERKQGSMKFSVVIVPLIMSVLASCSHAVRFSEEWITVERGPCFGFCPVYKVGLASSGEVTFEGVRHTAFIGTKQVQVSPSTAARVESKLAPYKPVGGQDKFECNEAVSDQPTFTVRWHQDGNPRVLAFDSGCRSPEAEKLRLVLEELPSDLRLGEDAKQITRPGVPRG